MKGKKEITTMKKLLLLLSFIVTIFIPSTIYAETNIPPRPTNAIYDPNNYLSKEVEKTLRQHNNNSDIQIGVYIVDSLDGGSIEDQANKIAREWKIGYKDEDKGALIAIAIKDKKFRIETSNKVAEYLTDGEARSLLDSTKEDMRASNYSQAVTKLIAGIEKEMNPDTVANSDSETEQPTKEKKKYKTYSRTNITGGIIAIGMIFPIIVGVGAKHIKNTRTNFSSVGHYTFNTETQEWEKGKTYKVPDGWDYEDFFMNADLKNRNNDFYGGYRNEK